MPTIPMKAPTQAAYTQVYGMPTGIIYLPTASGYVQADTRDVPAFLAMGYTPSARRDNVAATTDPAASNDSTQDYAVGSLWVNVTFGGTYMCVDATAAAAKWVSMDRGLLGRLIGANMNVTTDQAIPMFVGNSAFRVTKVSVKNASISLTTAAGGIYSAASKGGDAIVAAAQAYTALTTAALATNLTVAATPGNTVYAKTVVPTLSLTTAQGAAATADVYVWGDLFTSG